MDERAEEALELERIRLDDVDDARQQDRDELFWMAAGWEWRD